MSNIFLSRIENIICTFVVQKKNPILFHGIRILRQCLKNTLYAVKIKFTIRSCLCK